MNHPQRTVFQNKPKRSAPWYLEEYEVRTYQLEVPMISLDDVALVELDYASWSNDFQIFKNTQSRSACTTSYAPST